MMTPIEMQGYMFKTGRGYHKGDVDAFMEEVTRDYEQLYRENVELKDKLNTLSDGLQYYKDLEKTLQKTLVVAEKTAEETRESAHKKAEAVVTKAEAKAEALLSSVRVQAETAVNQLEQLKKQYENYRIQCKQLANAQLELLDSEAFKLSISTDFDYSLLTTSVLKKKEHEDHTMMEALRSIRISDIEEKAAPAHKSQSKKEIIEANEKVFQEALKEGKIRDEDIVARGLAKAVEEQTRGRYSPDKGEMPSKAAKAPLLKRPVAKEEAAHPAKGGVTAEERRREMLLKRERAVEILEAEGLKARERSDVEASAKDAKKRLKDTSNLGRRSRRDTADELYDDELFEFMSTEEDE